MFIPKKTLSWFLAVFICGSQVLAQVRFSLLKPQVIQSRLNRYAGDDANREKALYRSFSEAGCTENLSEQQLPRRKEPNVLCVLPGETEDVIVVGAHFDHAREGRGVVDNWSGASLLPSLFESLVQMRRKHTFLFVGFMGEEDGLIGSRFYVNQLSKPELARIRLMITLDSLGAGPTKVWVKRSDTEAVGLLAGVASALKLPLARVDVDGFGESDEEPFIKKKIRTITIHSLSSESIKILHSRSDTLGAIKFQDYYDTYHLLAAYLAALDSKLLNGSQETPKNR